MNFIPNFGWFGIFKTFVRCLGSKQRHELLPRKISNGNRQSKGSPYRSRYLCWQWSCLMCESSHQLLMGEMWQIDASLPVMKLNVLCCVSTMNSSPFLDDWTPVRFWNGSWKQCKKCWVTEYLSIYYPSWMSFLVVKKGHQVSNLAPTFHVWIEHSKFQKG